MCATYTNRDGILRIHGTQINIRIEELIRRKKERDNWEQNKERRNAVIGNKIKKGLEKVIHIAFKASKD